MLLFYVLLFPGAGKDADVLIMMIHHSPCTNHPLFFTTSKGSYDDRRIQESLKTEALHVILSLVVILFLPLPAMGNLLYLTGFLLGTLMNTWTSSLMYRLARM